MDLAKALRHGPPPAAERRLASRVADKRQLTLIGRMLKAKVVMPDGVKVATDEGINRYFQGWLGHFRVCTQGIE